MGWSSVASLLLASGSGVVLNVSTAYIMYRLRGLEEIHREDAGTAVGCLGKVYLNIPANGAMGGQVEVTISGRQQVADAITRGAAIPSFTLVRVQEALGNGILVVAPVDDSSTSNQPSTEEKA